MRIGQVTTVSISRLIAFGALILVVVLIAISVGALNPGHEADRRALDKKFRGHVIESLSGETVLQSPLVNSIEEAEAVPNGSAAIRDCKDFVFVLGQGSGWRGFNVLKVIAAGECTYSIAGAEKGAWRRARFQLNESELDGLKKKLTELDVFAMKRGYSAGIQDGTQWFVKVQASGQRKAIWCDNHFPANIVEISIFVGEKIIATHRREIEGATSVELKPEDVETVRW